MRKSFNPALRENEKIAYTTNLYEITSFFKTGRKTSPKTRYKRRPDDDANEPVQERLFVRSFDQPLRGE